MLYTDIYSFSVNIFLVSKTSSSYVLKISWGHALKAFLRQVWKTSWKYLQHNNLSSSMIFWRCLQDVLKDKNLLCRRCLQEVRKTCLEDVFETSQRPTKVLLSKFFFSAKACRKIYPEAFCKKAVLKNFTKSQENTSITVFFLEKYFQLCDNFW